MMSIAFRNMKIENNVLQLNFILIAAYSYRLIALLSQEILNGNIYMIQYSSMAFKADNGSICRIICYFHLSLQVSQYT